MAGIRPPHERQSEHLTAPEPMIERRGWQEFRDSGLLWWVNRSLHLFGWALVVELAEDEKTITTVYPARCRFRGFGFKAEEEGFAKLSKHLVDNAEVLLDDVLRVDP